MRGWVVKTPTVAVLCQTSRDVVREGLGNGLLTWGEQAPSGGREAGAPRWAPR